MAQNPVTTSDLGNQIPYDLRQIYASDLVGEHLKDIALARKRDNYSSYFKCLKDLFIITKHKFKTKKIKVKVGEEEPKEVTALQYYNLLIQNVVSLANKYPNEYTGHGGNADACALIEDSLNAIEMFLYEQINLAGMFGASRHVPGL